MPCLIAIISFTSFCFQKEHKWRLRRTHFMWRSLDRKSSSCVKIFAPLILAATGKQDLAKASLRCILWTSFNLRNQLLEKIIFPSVNATIEMNCLQFSAQKSIEVMEKASIDRCSCWSSFFELLHEKVISPLQKEWTSSKKESLDESHSKLLLLYSKKDKSKIRENKKLKKNRLGKFSAKRS